MSALLLAGLIVAGLPAADPVAKDILVRTELPLQTPRSRDPVLGGSRDKVYFQVWIPDGVKVVRGAICNPFSRDETPQKHWQAAARHWQFALVQTDFDGVRKDEFGLLEKALSELAKKSGHPELAHVPLCYTGMSRGGGMSMQLAELLPQRTLASVPVCLEVGPASAASRNVPVITVFGEKDGKQLPKLMEKLPKERGQGARWAIAVQWGRRHEFGQANNLSFVFLDDVIRRRLPDGATALKGPVRLNDIPLDAGWVGDISSWKQRPAPITPAAQFKGDTAQVCWLPTKRTAAVWQAFVSPHAREVKIAAPPGLGDKQPFVVHPAAKPVKVRVTLDPKLHAQAVELWDADAKLAERREGPWEFEVRLRPGIHSLIAKVTENGQSRLSRPHTIVVAEK
jgi:hypothetical protein